MQSLDDRRGRSSPAIREEKRSSLLEGKQVIKDHETRAFDRILEIFQEGKKSESISSVESSSTYCETPKRMISQKKSRVVKMKVF